MVYIKKEMKNFSSPFSLYWRKESIENLYLLFFDAFDGLFVDAVVGNEGVYQ